MNLIKILSIHTLILRPKIRIRQIIKMEDKMFQITIHLIKEIVKMEFYETLRSPEVWKLQLNPLTLVTKQLLKFWELK